MKQSVLKSLMVLLMAATSIVTADAQKTMDVSKFTRLDNDLMARVTKPVRDKDEGKLCALIRVVTNLTDLEVRADALGIVQQEKHSGELWLYVPYGARSLSFSHEGYYPLLYQYAEKIEEGTVYELRLGSYDTALDGSSQNLNTQMFVLSYQPDEATIFVDGVEVPSEYGVFAAMMSKGDHTYKVEANQFEATEGEFTLADEPVRRSVNLHPLFGQFQMYSLPENGFNVLLNGKLAGKTPFKSARLEPGSYRVRLEKAKFYPKDTVIRLREGDNLQYTTKLTSFSDSLFYNRILGGRSFSLGINVGYVMPFAKSTAGGDFVGSPVNYSLGDNRENVSYSSQSGFTVGILTDIRLYKNFYLMLGVNYSQVKYTNKFDKTVKNSVVFADEDNIWIGDVDNSYEEKYTLNWIEVPLLASYRFVLTKTASLHLNLGPYFTYGLSAKMKLAGSSDASGDIYARYGLTQSDTPLSTFNHITTHLNSEFDLYSKEFQFTQVREGSTTLGLPEMYESGVSPYKRFNYGLKAGLVYELRGFQLGVYYNLQLSNMGQSGFWEGPRIPIINGQEGSNNMTGYKHRVNSLEIKLGYVFRY